jgi:Ca-activated chloride channel family protein
MNRLLVVLFLHFVWISFGQDPIANDEFVLGDVHSYTRRFIDMKFGNPSDKKIYVLRVEHSPEVTYRLSSELLLPDSTVQFRIQVNPTKVGPFNYVIKVYFSHQSEPVVYRIKGVLKEKIEYDNYMTKCPDFNAKPAKKLERPELTIITVDKETGKPISRSTVSIIRNGEPAGTWVTGTSGKFRDNIPPGFFYFLASHEGYLPLEAGVFVGPEISEITIPLTRDGSKPEEKKPEPTREDATQLPKEVAEKELEKQFESIKQDSVYATDFPELASIPDSIFSPEYFKDVNVIFVLDISASMQMGEKMELMKFSLNELVNQLRTNDRMGIVTYSNNAKVLQPSVSGDNKSALKGVIGSLEAGGMTAGGKGIKLAYKEMMKNYDPKKANLVIIITDGAFNKDSDDYQKTVKKYAKKGVVFSVVGIQSRERDQVLMTEAATFGKGRFVLIKKLTDAYHNLTREIRIASYKGK